MDLRGYPRRSLARPPIANMTVPTPCRRGQSFWEANFAGLGLTLALPPLLFLWSSRAGFAWSSELVRGGVSLVALLATALALRLLLSQTVGPGQMARLLARRAWALVAPGGPAASQLVFAETVLVPALVVVTRLHPLTYLAYPMGPDSLHHTMITQLILDQGRLPENYHPYAPLESFTYHFGFHVLAALVSWLSELPAEKAVLVAGQALNVAAVLALYPPARELSGSHRAGVLAILVAGLLSPYPMGQINPGRYSQLAAQALLPLAAWLQWRWLHSARPTRWLAVLAMLVAAALALTHYRVAALFLLLVPIVALHARLQAGVPLSVLARRLGSQGIGAALLAGPWLVHLAQAGPPGDLVAWLWTATPARTIIEYNRGVAIGDYLTMDGTLLAAAGLLFALRRKGPESWMVGWAAVALLATNPQWLSLPGEGLISNGALLMVAYVPLALWGGALAAPLERLGHRNVAWRLATAISVAGLALWGATRTAGVVTLGYGLVRADDLAAATWIREHTSPDARFLINGRADHGAYALGTDGGWWLPLTAGRAVTIPPLLHTVERPGPGAQPAAVLALDEAAQRMVYSPEGRAMLRERGITHIYATRAGQVAGQIDPLRLEQSGLYGLIYEGQRVWIFAVGP